MSFEVRAIHETEREECIRLWCTVFAEDGDAYFRRYFYGDVDWLPYYTQVAVLDGKLVSAVHICKRTISCGDYRLTMGGIANVATLPEYRGHGYNTKCLQRAIEIMEADAMDFSLLGTGINGYYARLGYDTLPRPWLAATIRDDFKPLPTAFTVRPAIGQDAPYIREIYAGYNRLRPFTVQRTIAHWRGWIGLSEDHIPSGWMVAVDPGDSVQGYIKTDPVDHTERDGNKIRGVRISELGTWQNQEQEALIRALLDEVAAQALNDGRSRCFTDIAFEAAVMKTLNEIMSDITTRESTGGMVRLLHRENLLRGFTPEWNERWIAAGRPHGAVTFTTPYGPTRLEATGDLLRISTEADSIGALPQATFFGLLFGMMSPEQATSDERVHPLLAALFPPQAATYYDADDF